MKKKNVTAAVIVLWAALLGGCGNKGDAQELADGLYTADFTTDSSMFRVNETCEGKGTLTVENGKMTIHISLGSKKIINLYPGLAGDAEKEGAKLLMPTEDTITYSDGMTEEVYGFDVPVPYLGEEFDLALIGTKGKWYDHKVSVSNPVLSAEDAQAGSSDTEGMNAKDATALEDGTYSIDITFEGGSGKATVAVPYRQVASCPALQWVRMPKILIIVLMVDQPLLNLASMTLKECSKES